MMLRWLLAAAHLLALAIGMGSVWVRARALRGPLDEAGLRRVFAADSLWGVAGALWIATGLWRLLAGTEKTTAYYLGSPVFWLKMGALVTLLVLEVVAVVALIGWRQQVRRGIPVDVARAPVLARLSEVQALLVVVMVLAATAMARGLGT
jgi:putative membrane protein